jgi:hypothetical protein
MFVMLANINCGRSFKFYGEERVIDREQVKVGVMRCHLNYR